MIVRRLTSVSGEHGNPLGVKGVGEAGTIGIPPAIVAAGRNGWRISESPTSACRSPRTGSGRHCGRREPGSRPGAGRGCAISGVMSELLAVDKSSTFGNRIRPAYQQVADQVRELILRGELALDERLPVESNLAVLFGVSRSTVREALRLLSSQQLVRTARGVGGGSFVAQPDPGHVSDFLQTSIGLLTGTHQVSLAELIEARALLEVPAAELAAGHRSDEDAAALVSLASAEAEAPTSRLGQSKEFHLTLLRAAGNRLIEVMTGPVFSVLAQRFLPDAIDPAAWDELCNDHVAIAAAISGGDGERAGAVMRAHIGRMGEIYRDDTEAPAAQPAV